MRAPLRRATVGVALALVLAACGGADTGAEAPTPGGATDPTTEPTDPTTEPSDPTTDPTGDPDEASGLEGVEVVPEGQELLLRTDGEVEVIALLDPEGESFFRYATIHPDSTRDDLTIVALTQAEGFYDLRWMTVRDGEPSELEAFEPAYQPNPALASVADVAPIPQWSPDGRSLAWVEWDADGEVTLRTIGWESGPGTGRTADDNASFVLSELPAGVQTQSWTDQTGLRVLADDGRVWQIDLERQSDGALALGPDAVHEVG